MRRPERRPAAGQPAVARLAAGLLALLAACPALAQQPAREDRVFTIGNYPIEARADNAVEAKNRAITEGQQAAFRSLLKRIVPVTAYNRMARLRSIKATDLVEGVAVRSERNSSTEYIATYDITFQSEAVRRLLDRENIPFLDRQAPPITLLPVYLAPKEPGLPEQFEDARGADAWLYAWKGLDLANTLTPVSLKTLKREVHADTLKALAAGDASAVRILVTEYKTETVMVALLEPDLAQKKVSVVIAGRDAVAPFALRRQYRLDGPDLAYTAELAAVVSLGILEGRWKTINLRRRGSGGASAAPREAPPPIARPEPGFPERAAAGPGVGGPGGIGSAAGPAGAMRISVEFRDMGEWQRISRQLSATPDVTELDVEGLSGRSARITLRYPRSAQDLALVLAQNGLILRNAGGGWLLTQR